MRGDGWSRGAGGGCSRSSRSSRGSRGVRKRVRSQESMDGGSENGRALTGDREAHTQHTCKGDAERRKKEEERKGVIYCRGDERGDGMIIFREGAIEFICEQRARENWGVSRQEMNSDGEKTLVSRRE